MCDRGFEQDSSSLGGCLTPAQIQRERRETENREEREKRGEGGEGDGEGDGERKRERERRGERHKRRHTQRVGGRDRAARRVRGCVHSARMSGGGDGRIIYTSPTPNPHTLEYLNLNPSP